MGATRISTAQFYSQAVDLLRSRFAELARTQRQLASGRRFATPSEDPTGAVRVLKAAEGIARLEQAQRNVATARRRLEAEEAALTGGGDILQRARELAVRGANDTLSAADREAIAREVDGLVEDLLGVANATDGNGGYLFSGYRVRTAPFARKAGGGFEYRGDEGQPRLNLSEGLRIALGDPGTRVFARVPTGNGTFVTGYAAGNAGTGVIGPGTVQDPTAWVPDTYTITFTTATDWEVRDSASNLIASGTYTSGGAISFRGISVEITGAPAAGDAFTVQPAQARDAFSALEALAAALRAPGGTPADRAKRRMDLNRALQDIDQALERVLEVRAEVGARLNAVDLQEQVNEDALLAARRARSSVEDLDYAEAASRMERQLLALQAAQKSFSRVAGLSLFQYL